MDTTASNLQKVLCLIGDKWSLLILMDLHRNGRRRFSECQKYSGVNTKTLTQRLEKLEEAGLISRHEYQEYPPRIEYELTDKGRALVPACELLAEWSKEYLAKGV